MGARALGSLAERLAPGRRQQCRLAQAILLEYAGEGDEALRLLRALRRPDDPTSLPVETVLAWQLARSGRLRDAVAACRPYLDAADPKLSFGPTGRGWEAALGGRCLKREAAQGRALKELGRALLGSVPRAGPLGGRGLTRGREVKARSMRPGESGRRAVGDGGA